MHYRQRIIRITTWIAALVAMAVTLLLPFGYFTVSYQFLAGSLEAEAEMTSHIITGLINANPEMWPYEQLRLEEALARRMRDGHSETRRILDLKNRPVAESLSALNKPLLTRSFDLMDAGVIVGKLEISRSLFPLLLRSGFVALLGLLCGMVIFVTMRVLPLSAVARAEKSLRESESLLSDKVTLLEEALAKVKHLEGIIPICMYCKKIRNDEESWQQLESYISEHSEAYFSHGVCPDCFQKMYGEELKKLESLVPR